MQRPWLPEEVVSRDRATLLIEETFPDLAPVSIAELGDGWDNTAFLVNDAWVFRFPRRQVAVKLLEAECSILPALAGRLPLAVPEPTLLAGPGADFPWPFAGYRLLDGRTGCRAILTDEQRGAYAAPLGRFLSALHGFPAEEARDRGVDPDLYGRLDFVRHWAQTVDRLTTAAEHGWIPDPHRWDAIRIGVPQDWSPAGECLVHGDLYARHVLVDDDAHLCGVIDWGDVHLGDPAVDLAIAHSFLPPAAHGAFLEAYGEVSRAAWAAARMRALVSAVAILVYGNEVRDAALKGEAQRALAFLDAGSG